MAEFKITRFRYIWKGDWNTSVLQYNKDDVVYYQGSAWVCIRQHEPTIFQNDIEFTPPGDTLPAPAWTKMIDGREFLGEWSSTTVYNEGVLVLAGGNLYLCVDSHTSSANFSSDILRWEIFAVGSNFRNEWIPSTVYRIGDIIRYNGNTYQCILEHTSSTISEGIVVGVNDSDDEPDFNDSTAETWKIVTLNYSFVGEYDEGIKYRKNDLVKFGGSIVKCIKEHTSLATINSNNFETYLPGFNFSNQWTSSQQYAVGDVVRFGGNLYQSLTNNSNSTPGISGLFPTGNPNWSLIEKAIDYKGVFDPAFGTLYKEGDLVRRGGSLWVSLTDQTAEDDSSLVIFSESSWEFVISSYGFRNSWTPGEFYNLYDVVYYRGIVYFANTPHQSTLDNFPGDNGEGFNYWSLVLVGDTNASLTNLGDLLTYNKYRFSIEAVQGGQQVVKILGDDSTLGSTSIPIGEEDQVLVVENNEGDIGYKVWGNIQRVFFVRTNGVDDDTDPNRGINYFKPYKTLRYALEKADDGFEGTTTIKISTGEYKEILPLIIPTRTAIVGEELRSVTIKPNDPTSILGVNYFVDGLTRIGGIFSDLLLGNVITKTVGNAETQITSPVVTNTEFLILDNIWSAIITNIQYKVFNQGSAVTVSGSNTETNNFNLLNTIQILELNREFIKSEFIAYIEDQHPSFVFDADEYNLEIDKFIDSVKYDLRFSGNYKSVMASRVYANKHIGSQLEDMFYVRDTTGIRNMTLRGLEGTLPELQEGETYRIPTGGAFVSLDPGWGPNDERVWITNRSCYVQNVTTFGAGAIGQKIDGLLHNGGNKSIVSNDFTQVISDGIGAWVQNGGRAELVSVFTYYAHIGMFAKNGGIIRATNGNSSYGDFGAVADGIDPDEVVRFGKVNTRTEQAIVDSAFAGEILDFILGLEFRNAGQEYTTASYNFISSGTGAQTIQEEFRDGGIFETQVINPGSGFTQYGNQAQGGNANGTIILSASENVTLEQIQFMRLIIISGEGTGQYGMIINYNPGTKECTVGKEIFPYQTSGEEISLSEVTVGWDHINPGTPSAQLLTTGTRYRIEPLPIFLDPPYSATEYTLSSTNTWASLTYGETSETFNSVAGQLGTGSTTEVIPVAAQFTVSKIGRTYSVSLSSGGAGYAINDTIVINGADVGGISGEHDIALRVLTVSDDSTNSILTFEISDSTPIAASGKFILAPTTGHFGRYSPDGENWTSFDFPTDGNWKCLASGNNKFVAIANGTNQAASSSNGKDWTARSMPASRNWNAVAYGRTLPANGNGVFVAVAGNLNAAAYSTDGENWVSSTLPTFGDSTFNEYVDIAFGANKFVAIANSGNIAAVGTWNGTTLTWQGTIMDVVADSSAKNWISITYGNRRFVAISSTGDVAYSFDGLNWNAATMPTQDGSTIHNWKQIRYGQGVFFAVGDTAGRNVGADPTSGPTTWAVTSYDGIVWTERTLASNLSWGLVAFGNPDVSLGDSTVSNSKPMWVVAPSTLSDKLNRVFVGAKAKGRAVVDGGGLARVKMWEPGSGYDTPPPVYFISPNSTVPTVRPRIADGVLAQPTFIAKGSAYKTSTTSVTVSGDGFADIIPVGRFITIDNLDIMPGPGAQFYIAGRENFYTAVIVGIDEQVLANGKIRATFQISPRPTLTDFIEHDMEVLIRERYSQVRITGHDFLDIGTGNFEETNYPDLYTNYDFTTQPFQEVQNLNGGRVFYTSTDQDGNFRAGEQFAVEQATGIITISADFFDLRGLTELRLAGINVGSTAVIREFSKDPLFLQNSNNIIPTQRAIRAYLGSRLNIGGEDLLTPSITGGTVKVGPNSIESTADLVINVPVVANFAGQGAGISGSMLAQTMFFRSFNIK